MKTTRPRSPNGKTRCFAAGCRNLVAENRFHCPGCLETSAGRSVEDSLWEALERQKTPQRTENPKNRWGKKRGRALIENTHGLIGDSRCRRCQGRLDWFRHSEGWRPKRNQQHYFSAWQVCSECNAVFNYERYKVFIREESEKARDYRLSRQLQEETAQAAERWGI